MGRWAGPIFLAWVILAGLVCIASLITAARRRETRARLFEVVRLALLRGQAVAPILRQALANTRIDTRLRPALKRSAEHAEAGRPVTEALVPIATREQRLALARVGDEHGLASLPACLRPVERASHAGDGSCAHALRVCDADHGRARSRVCSDRVLPREDLARVERRDT